MSTKPVFNTKRKLSWSKDMEADTSDEEHMDEDMDDLDVLVDELRELSAALKELVALLKPKNTQADLLPRQ